MYEHWFLWEKVPCLVLFHLVLWFFEVLSTEVIIRFYWHLKSWQLCPSACNHTSFWANTLLYIEILLVKFKTVLPKCFLSVCLQSDNYCSSLPVTCATSENTLKSGEWGNHDPLHIIIIKNTKHCVQLFVMLNSSVRLCVTNWCEKWAQ
jgi:hypothetical protein